MISNCSVINLTDQKASFVHQSRSMHAVFARGCCYIDTDAIFLGFIIDFNGSSSRLRESRSVTLELQV